MDPITMGIGAGLQGAMGIGKMIAGGIQAKRGKKDLAALEANRPVYERPEEVNQAGQISRLRYLNPNMPGQGLMEQQVGQQQANTLQNIQDMGGVADIYQTQINSNNAMNNIGVQAASQRLQNEMNLLNQLAVEADYSDKEFDTNTYIPWQENRKSALDRIGAGTQNLFGGMDNLASMGVGFMGLAGGDKSKSGATAASQVMGLTNLIPQFDFKAKSQPQQIPVNNQSFTPGLTRLLPGYGIEDLDPSLKSRWTDYNGKPLNIPQAMPIDPDMTRQQNPSFPIIN